MSRADSLELQKKMCLSGGEQEREYHKDVKKTVKVAFSARQHSIKPVHIHTWDEVENKNYGFLKDGRLRLMIFVKLVHVDWNATMNFSHRDPFLSDATLLVGNVRYHVNKMYLAQYSGFFKRMFSSRFDDAIKEEIPLKVESSEHFENFLRCLYPEQRKVTENDLRAFIPKADYFEVPKLMDECGELLLEAQTIALAERLFLANKYNLHVAQIRLCEQLDKQDEIKKVKSSSFYEEYPKDLRMFILKKMVKLDE